MSEPILEGSKQWPATNSPANLFSVLSGQNLILFAIIFLAFLLRFFQLGYRSVWYDESFSIILARQDFGTILNGTAHDYHPPLFYLVLSIWLKIFGEGVYAARFLSLLFGVGAVWVLYLLAKNLFGPKTALVAAFIAAIAPFQVLYSQEVRMYSLEFLLGGWLILSFYRAYRRDSWQDWGWFGLSAILALYNLYFSLFSLTALGLFFAGAMLYYRLTRKNWLTRKIQRWLITHLIIFGLYLPWLFVLVGQIGRVKNSYWISRPNPLEIFRLLNIFLYNTTNLTVDAPFDLIGLLLAVFLLLFTLQAARFRLRSGAKGRVRRSFEIALLLTCWLAPLLIVLTLSYLFTPIYLERSLIMCAVPAYILVARVITTANRPNLWPLLFVPALALALISLYFYYFSPDYTVHYDSAAASSWVARNSQPGDIVIHINKLSYLPFVYLKTPGSQFVVPEEPGNSHDDLSPETQKAIGLQYTPIEKAVSSLGKQNAIWLVLTPPQPGQTDYQERIVKGYLDSHFKLHSLQTFFGETIFLYVSL